MKRHTDLLWPHAAALLALAAGAAQAQVGAPVPAPPAPAAPATSQTAKASAITHRDDLGKLPKPNDLKPTGPVTVTAKTAELVQGNSAIYTGNVVLTSDTLKMDGDRVEIQQFPGGQYTAKITGGPAHMSHAGDGPENPPVAAHAKTLNYDSRNGLLDLLGDALFMRGDDVITGDTIHYNVNERRVQASGGDGGQVKIVIQPTDTPVTPAPAAPSVNVPPGKKP